MAFVNRYTTTQHGAIVITGNTLGLSKINNLNSPGTLDSEGGFITTNTALITPASWLLYVNLLNSENITLNWQENSSAAFLNMPVGASVLYAELIWGGLGKSLDSDITSVINNAISFTTPLGTNSVSPDPVSSYNSAPAGSAEIMYARSQNVTSIVSAAGTGKYTVGAVPALLVATNNANNFAGWSLIVVYKYDAFPARNMSVFSGGQLVSASTSVDTTVSGFITPTTGTITARILSSAAEGDANRPGDYMQFGPTTSSLIQLYGPNNPANPPNALDNFFASQINIGDPTNPNVGQIDTTGTFGSRNHNAFTATNITAGRQGWDITNVDGSTALINGQTSAVIRFGTDSDVYLPNGLAIQIDTLTADLSIQKTANPATAVAGQLITYTLNIVNNGPNTAQNTVLTDIVPTSISNPQFSTNGGATWNTWVSPYTIGNIVDGGIVTILIRGTVNASATGTLTNTASLSSTTPDDNTNNNTSTLVTNITSLANMTVVKTANPSPVTAGQMITYTMVVSNAGPSDAQNVSLSDTVPSSISNPQFSTNGGVTWNTWVSPYSIGTVASGASVTILLRGTVNSGTTGSITNTATVNSTTPDANPGTKTSTVVTPVNTSADLSVTKADTPDPVIAGNQLTYTIVVANAGPSDAANTVLTDVIVSDLLNPQYSTDGGTTWNTWVNPYPIGNLASGSNVTVLIRGTVSPNALTSISNTATVSSSTQDPNPNNNSATAVTQINTSADISVTKSDIPDPVIAGQTLTYTITIGNAGPSASQNVTLTDNLAAVLLTPQYSIDGGITWNNWVSPYAVGLLSSNTSTIVQIRGTVSPAASNLSSISNTATVSSTTSDPNPNNNSATVTTLVNTSADISVIKTANESSIIAGEQLIYTITVLNAGPSNAQNVVLTDVTPATLLTPEYSIDGGVTWNSWVSPYTIGTLASGGNTTLAIRGTVNSAATGNITNTATVSSATLDPNPNNNTSTITIPITASAEIGITKLVNTNPVIAGQSITYSIFVANGGPSDSVNIVITDDLPVTISSPEFSIDGGITWSIWTGTYGVPRIVAGTTFQFLIRGMLDEAATGTLINTAKITAATPDPIPGNDSSTVTSPITTLADVAIIKQDNPDPIIAGDVLTYLLTVSNIGPSVAQNVVVADTVPAVVLNPEYSLDNGLTWQNWVSPLSLGNLVVGSIIDVQIRGTVNPNTTTVITNTATATSTTTDPDPTDNTSTITTQVNTSADLAITKVGSPNPVLAGQVVTYTLVVQNLGISDAQNVVLTDNVPATLTNVQFSLNNGSTWSSWVSPYAIGTLPSGSTLNILLRGTVNPGATGTITNTATISASTSDPNPGNNTATFITGINNLADLSVVKTGSENPILAGNVLTYTITIQNGGPSPALNVSLSDSIPSKLVNPQFSTDGGITWNTWVTPYSIGTINSGSTVTILIRGAVDPLATGTITNTATVTTTTPVLNPNNTTSTVVTAIDTLADLSITKTSNPTVALAGDVLTYTLEIANGGPNEAVSVTLTDAVPTQLSGVQFSIDGGLTWNPWSSPLSIGNLSNGATLTVLIRGTVNPNVIGTITNTATISSTTPDANPNNNTATLVTQVNTLADVAVNKTSSLNGSILTYTIQVSNAGPSDAQGINVADDIPPEILNPQYSLDNGATWTAWVSPLIINTLSVGNIVTLLIRGNVNPLAIGTISNTVRVNAVTVDPNPSNNISSVSTKLTDLADLSITKLVNPNSVEAGQKITYTLLMLNQGPDTAQNVQLIDNTPSDVLNPEYSLDNGVTWQTWVSPYSLGNLINGAFVTMQIRGTISPGATDNVINTATISSQTPDPNPNNNTSSITATITTAADVAITKLAVPSPAVAGTEITYTLTVANNGPSNAQGVRIDDVVPIEIKNPEYSIDNGVTWNLWVTPYDLGELVVGTSTTILIRGSVDSGVSLPITNTATVTATTFDPNPVNNTAQVITDVVTSADVTVVKIGGPLPAIAGRNFTYTITVSNLGPSDAQDVSVADDVLSLENAQYSVDGGISWFTWTTPYSLGTIKDQVSTVILIRGEINPATTGDLTNTVNVSSTTPDPVIGNNTATFITTIAELVDLTVVKTAQPNPVIAGQVITYSFEIANAGPSDAKNVSLTDDVPAVVSSPQLSLDGGITWQPWVSPYSIGTVSSNTSQNILIRGNVSPAAQDTITNTAIINSTTPDINPGTKSSTVVTQVDTLADLVVVKDDEPDPVIAGEVLTYPIVISNLGPSDAQNVVVTDNIVSNILNAEYSMDGGMTWNTWVNPYTLGSIAVNTTLTMYIRGTVSPAATGSLANTVTITSTTRDPNPNNNTSTVSTNVDALADVAISKVAIFDTLNRGDLVAFALQITNLGPSDAMNVVLSDVISSLIQNPQFSINNGLSWNPWVTPYTLGTVSGGQTQDISIRGIVSQSALGVITNTAVVGSSTEDPDLSNNTSTASINIVYADLTAPGNFVKSVDKQYADIGETLTYTITVKNTGNIVAEQVVILDPMPNGTSYVSGSLTGTVPITGEPATGISVTNGIAPGASMSLSFKVKVEGLPIPNPISNVATVTYAYTVDPTKPNGVIGSGNTNTVTTQINHADLASPGNIVKVVNKAFADVGEELTYTLTLKNTGNVTANNVIITDPIPQGTTYVANSLSSSVPVVGTPETSITIVNGISANQIITLLFKVYINEVPVLNPIPNTASVNYRYTVNPNLPNGAVGNGISNTVTTQVNHGEILPENAIKAVSKGITTIGDQMTYTITITNTGNVPIQANIIDVVPLGTAFVLGSVRVDSVSRPNDNPNLGVDVGSLNPKETVDMAYDVTILEDAPGQIDNKAQIIYSYEVEPSQPQVSQTVWTNTVETIVLRANLSLEKGTDRIGAVVGDIIRYTITATNKGQVVLESVVVKDVLAQGLSEKGNVTLNNIPISGSIVSGINIGQLAIGETKIIAFDAEVVSVPTDKNIPNDAEASYTYRILNSTFTGSSISNTVNTRVYAPGLVMTKEASRSAVKVGDQFNYEITAKNSGDIDLEDVIITDELPSAFTVTNITVDEIAVTGSLQLGLNIGELQISQEKRIVVTIKVMEDLKETFFNVVNGEAKAVVDPIKPPAVVIGTATDQTGVAVYNVSLALDKSVNRHYAIVGESVTYTIVVENTGDLTLGNVALNPITIYDLLSPSLEFIQGTVTVDGKLLPDAGIVTGVDIGTLQPGEKKIVSFKAKVISNLITPITNNAHAVYGFQLPGNPPDTGESTSNVATLIPEVANLNIIKTADKDFAVLDEVITYTVKIQNTGTVDALNVIFKDELSSAVQLIKGSFSVNGNILNGVDPLAGVNIGTIKKQQYVIISYKAKVIKSNCKSEAVNKAQAVFNYNLPDGNSGTVETSPTATSSVIVDLGIISFKQLSVDKTLTLADDLLDIGEITDVTGKLRIVDYHLASTKQIKSYEGQNLSGYELNVYGILDENVSYVTIENQQAVHAATYTISFTTFIVLGQTWTQNKKLEVSGTIEDIYFKKIDTRTLFTNATILINVVVCES